ncbi:MAG: hypothetical protein VKL59_21630 [Nostocaceae cyanobacterium]|nr:hypothetical protein [Nostocaceae cyanobacterium]
MEESTGLSLQEQLALRLEVEISKKMDKIIDNIRTIAKDFSIAEKDKKSPFRNVLAAATESGSSLEVIKNYIRYQVGRSGASPIWKHTKNQKLFSTVVVEQINSLQQEAAEIVLSIREYTPKGHPVSSYLENGQNQAQLQKEIHLKLAQLYLGYLAREHTASVGEKQVQSNQNPN